MAAAKLASAVLVLVCGIPAPAAAAPSPGAAPPASAILNVGALSAPPFMIKQPDGTWTGVAAELWNEVARREKLAWRYDERAPDGLVAGIIDGSLDVVAYPMEPTLERERLMDFTYSWYRTGIGIAVQRPSESRRWLRLGQTLLSAGILKVLAVLLLSLAVAGLVMWRFEKRSNPDHFGPGLKGYGDGVWWAAVTATSVGYGDRVPVTPAGRAVAVAWMLLSVLFISAFTGSVAARVAIEHFEEIRTADDLRRVRVVVIEASSSAEYARRHSIRATPVGSAEEAFRAVARGDADAFLAGEAILRHQTLHAFPELIVLPTILEPQTYSFGLANGSLLRERLNRRLLEVLDEPVWHSISYRYFGN